MHHPNIARWPERLLFGCSLDFLNFSLLSKEQRPIFLETNESRLWPLPFPVYILLSLSPNLSALLPG